MGSLLDEMLAPKVTREVCHEDFRARFWSTRRTQRPQSTRRAPGALCMSLTLTSAAFEHGQPIPRRYTCEGDDISPPLEWAGVPAGTKSLALIVDDPDAPDPAAPKRVWTHWVLANLPADCTGLAEGLGGADLPAGTIEGLNDWKKLGYGGPCPPVGQHRYFFRLYALDRTLEHLDRPTRSELEHAMKGHVLQQAELIGAYKKRK